MQGKNDLVINLDQKFCSTKPPPKEPYEIVILNMFQSGRELGYKNIVIETPISLSQAVKICDKFQKRGLIEEVEDDANQPRC